MRDFFAFRRMISGVVIQVVFVLGLIGIVIAGLASIANDQVLVGLLILVFGGLYWRIVCEVFIVLFRMNKSLDLIRSNTAGLATAFPPAAGTPLPASSETGDAPAAVAPAAPAAAVSETSTTAALPAPGWYPDSERPGHKRWWDGTTWGKRDDEESSP